MAQRGKPTIAQKDLLAAVVRYGGSDCGELMLVGSDPAGPEGDADSATSGVDHAASEHQLWRGGEAHEEVAQGGWESSGGSGARRVTPAGIRLAGAVAERA